MTIDLDGLSRPFPFAERVGYEVLEARRGHVRARVPLEPNRNHIGIMYAGALYTLSEMPGGALAVATFDPERTFPIVVATEIRYLSMATTDVETVLTMGDDEIARIEADLARHGKARFDLDADLTGTDGTVVATATGHYQLRSHHPAR